jgi:phosphate starvation-inducible protein PhoH and related proteins
LRYTHLNLIKLIEKVITLDSISLVDFLGIENCNIKQIATAFPASKVFSRGNEIFIQGQTAEIMAINEILQSLIEHYNKYGKVTEENVNNVLHTDSEVQRKELGVEQLREEALLYGVRGNAIKPKTANQAQQEQAKLILQLR